MCYFQGIDLNVGDLQMYGTVSWLNALDEIGKIKKGIDLVCTLFVFKSGVVLLAQERIKGKKKPKVKYPYNSIHTVHLNCWSNLLPISLN